MNNNGAHLILFNIKVNKKRKENTLNINKRFKNIKNTLRNWGHNNSIYESVNKINIKSAL